MTTPRTVSSVRVEEPPPQRPKGEMASHPAPQSGRFTLEQDGQPLAAVTLRGGIGVPMPRYWYRLGCSVHASRDLGLYSAQSTLLLTNDLTGSFELIDMTGDVGRSGAIALLRSVIKWLGAHRAKLEIDSESVDSLRLVASLPGVRDAEGHSPFWNGLGAHFFKGDPEKVRADHGERSQALIATLLPRQLIYTSFLPEAARGAIGQVQASAQTWQRALESVGLYAGQYVSLDDGGPVLTAPLISLWKDAEEAP